MKKSIFWAVAIPTIAVCIILFLTSSGEIGQEENAGYIFSNDWLNKRNLYVFGSPPPDYLRSVNATGVVWEPYGKEYVDNIHDNGFKACSGPGMISSIVTDNQILRETAHCVDINGNPAYFSSGMYYMCHNNPEWQEFLESKLMEYADIGVDAIHIDETGAVGDLSSSGFCHYCMAGFRSYLAQHYSAEELRDKFGIEDVASFDYRTYLLSHGAQSAWQDPSQELLGAYFRFQYSSKCALVGDLIQNTRSYAGRDILFSANTYGLFTDHQIYMPYLDFAVFEMSMRPLPEGKHFARYLLGDAMAPPKPLVAFPGPDDWTSLSEDNWWLWRHWLAEAYACGGSFLLPYDAYTYGGDRYTLPADKISPYTKFISNNPRYYENISRVAKAAVLFDFRSQFNGWVPATAWMAWDSFENMGRDLQEAHIPFEVVYVGDGEFVDKPITLGDLEKYSVVAIPGHCHLDAATENLFDQYTQFGGHVVRADSIPEGSDLVTEIRNTGVDLGLETNASEDLSVMVYGRENSLLVHLVNYSYDRITRDFTPQTQIEITIIIPTNVDLTGKTLKLLSPDTEQETILEYTVQDDEVTFTIASVHVYSIASFES